MSHPQPDPSGQNPNGFPRNYGTPQDNIYTNGPSGKKKGGCLKILGIIVGIVVLLLLLAGACSAMTSNFKDTQPADTATSTSAPESSAPGTAAETTTGAGEESSAAAPVETQAADSNSAEASPAQTQGGDVPREYISALKSAESYSKTLHMSQAGIYDQLTSEYGGKFSPAAAQYAIDNMDADWNANALASAKNYQDTMNMSPAAIQDQLTSEYGGKFTPAQAAYAIQNLNK